MMKCVNTGHIDLTNGNAISGSQDQFNTDANASLYSIY